MSDFLSPFTGFAGEAYFNKIIAFHEEKNMDWARISKEIPLLPRGWFELSRFESNDRIEFTRDYWLAKLPLETYEGQKMEQIIHEFFLEIDDIGIYATQHKEGMPYDIHMIYSMQKGQKFFHGSPPAKSENINAIQKQFSHCAFPNDYLSFLTIHDGFCRYTDTGLIRTRDMAKTYLKFQDILQLQDINCWEDEITLQKKGLIPFYESAHLHCYQCFYAGWQPNNEMGNLFCSEDELIMSDFLDGNNLVENLAFTSFLNWLAFYLQEDLE